jgi:adenine specific DNA methylase Mod
MSKNSVDLIYLDPPFKSQQNYNLLYTTLTGKPVPEQAEAFCDTWEMDAEKERVARRMPELMTKHGADDYYAQFWQLWMNALRDTQPQLLAYLIYMVQRLLHMKSILKPTGSIFLHCDPEASHYIKVMMDGIFGHDNFRNEVIWKRTASHNSAKRFGPVHDVILYYGMDGDTKWNPQFQDYDEKYLDKFSKIDDETGKRFQDVTLTGPGVREGPSGEEWRGVNPTDKGRHWQPASYLYDKYEEITGEDLAQYPFLERLDRLDEAGLIYWTRNDNPRYKQFLEDAKGVPLSDVWTDISAINSQSKKRMGYPTQKPVPLLDRIIRCTTNEGDVVFDPFCGCGTTIYAAHEAQRKWVGCDIAILAVRLVEDELSQRYGLVKGEHYIEDGIPNSRKSAKALWESDPYQFEHWAVEKVGGFPTKKTGDEGVDGRIYFEMGDDLGSMVLSVKGGGVGPSDIRDLAGVLSSDPSAQLAGFISNEEPTKGMKAAAAKPGMWEHRGEEYERIQMLTVEEIIEEGRRFRTPTKVGSKSNQEQRQLAL